jgi:hypothetical protein
MRAFILLVAIALLSFSAKSQNIGIGADVMYNFQTESFGAGARVSIFPYNRLSIVPQVAYYFPFSFNKVNELNLGLALEYKFIYRERFHIYAIAHGAYNRWLNYAESPMTTAKPTNLNLEGGLGISTNGRLRPFLEYRYNIRFLETHLRVGVLYIPGSNHGRAGSGVHDRRCDAYNN